MAKGEVPIAYIIALLLGIAVVAILGYWFFVMGGQFGGGTTLEACKTKAYTYCANWQTKGYAYDGNGKPDLSGPNTGKEFGEAFPECLSNAGTLGFNGGDDVGNCQRIVGTGG